VPTLWAGGTGTTSPAVLSQPCRMLARTEQQKVFLVVPKGEYFLLRGKVFAWLLLAASPTGGYRMSIFVFQMHLGLGNVDWKEIKL